MKLTQAYTRQFIGEHVKPQAGVVTARAVIYAAYREWCMQNQFWPESQKALVAAMRDGGFDQRGRAEETADGRGVITGFFANVQCTYAAPAAPSVAGLN